MILAALTLAAGAITAIPADPQAICPMERARLYANCADQRTLFVEGLTHARAEGKVLLVSYGAEWCIWCHVIDAELSGLLPGDATPAEAATAEALADFAAGNFVVVHIDADALTGAEEVLAATGAAPHYPGAIPFLFTVDDNGRFVAEFSTEAAQTEDRQGRPVHDRAILLEMLRALVPPPAVERTGLIR